MTDDVVELEHGRVQLHIDAEDFYTLPVNQHERFGLRQPFMGRQRSEVAELSMPCNQWEGDDVSVFIQLTRDSKTTSPCNRAFYRKATVHSE